MANKTVIYLVILLAGLWGLVACGQVGDEVEETAVEPAAVAQLATRIPSITPLPTVAHTATLAHTPTATVTPNPAFSPTPTPLPTATPTPTPTYAWPTGALIDLQMQSRVAVLLNEFPEGLRDRVADYLLERPDSFWQERAYHQTRLIQRRLNFRNFFYDDGRGQLPVPPHDLWQFELDPAGAYRETVGAHDLVLINYTFRSLLLTDEASPGIVEPALAQIGGIWNEPFLLPLDPDHLVQRLGNACFNESGYPPRSYDSVDGWLLFDHGCTPDSVGALGCHRSLTPPRSCQEMMNLRVGVVNTAVRFERLPWDSQLADQFRVGEVTNPDGADLAVAAEVLNHNRIIYRYFTPNSCGIIEGCVNAPGWRRLLQFEATAHNQGTAALHIGLAVENLQYNAFHYDACHDHYHFNYYGDFVLGLANGTLSRKQAFCVESTSRYSNNETSPLHHPYTCTFQGIAAGWVDEYISSLECQWLDITDLEVAGQAATIDLAFLVNREQFLCEGSPILDENGRQVWEPTSFLNEFGATVYRPMCEFMPGWDENNSGAVELTIYPEGSYITQPCASELFGPLRNCGFRPQLDPPALAADSEAKPFSCIAGEQVTMTCNVVNTAVPQTLRICEYSDVLGTGVACTFEDALANSVVGVETSVAFTCPFRRGEDEPGGRYAFYTSPLLNSDPYQSVQCAIQP